MDIISELKEYNINVDIVDPWCESRKAEHEYGLSLFQQPKAGHYDVMTLAVAHNEFREMSAEAIHAFCKPTHVLYDLKYVLAKDDVDMRL